MLVYLHVQTTSFVLQVQQLFQAEVPERIIQKTTGHRSLKSLCTYEHNSNDQQQAVSQVMMLTDSASSTGELKKVTTQEVTVTQDTGSASANNMGKLLGDLTNCSIGQITINVNPNIHPLGHEKDDGDNNDEFDELIKNVDLDIC